MKHHCSWKFVEGVIKYRLQILPPDAISIYAYKKSKVIATINFDYFE